jgi:hypothetical protein
LAGHYRAPSSIIMSRGHPQELTDPKNAGRSGRRRCRLCSCRPVRGWGLVIWSSLDVTRGLGNVGQMSSGAAGKNTGSVDGPHNATALVVVAHGAEEPVQVV